MNIPKCYIAGKISGLPVDEYTAKFAIAEDYINVVTEYVAVNPVTLPHNHDKTWLSYMRECLRAMLECEAVYFLSDWAKSDGANIEYRVANLLGLKIFHE